MNLCSTVTFRPQLYVGIYIATLILPLLCCDSHPVPTYFHRANDEGELIDASASSFKLRIENFTKTPDISQEGIEFNAFPSLIGNGDLVEISWFGVKQPREKDFIALYCPPEDNLHTYLDYIFVSDTAWKDKNGYSSFKVALYNMRTACEFRYVKFDGSSAEQVARSNVVEFKGGSSAPLQGHLALTGKPSEMRVMWTSGTNASSIVKYGRDPLHLALTAKGSCKTYKGSDMCGEPASTTGFIDPGYIHDVLITELDPDTLYFYQFGSLESMSPVYNFTSAPMPDPDISFKFVAYGDMGVTPNPGSCLTAKYAFEEVKDGSRLVLHFGDVSYARGHAYLWDQWHALIEPYATLVPYMVGIGNHEQDHTKGGAKDPSGAPGEGFHPSWGNYADDSGGECGVPMFYRFHMPDNGNYLWWYSFDYGSVHFVMMSTEHNFTQNSRQYNWLKHDLEQVNRSQTPWVVFMGHRPMYDSQIFGGNRLVGEHMMTEFEDILYINKVDLALWGHYHSYQRTCPVYRKKCTSGAPTHVTVGTAGYILSPFPAFKDEWSMFHATHFGYGRVTVANQSALLWEWVKNLDGKVTDSLWLQK